MATADNSLKLIQIQIETPEKIWDRCLISNNLPVLTDLEFYYRELLGFCDAKVTLTHETIPDDFNASLLPNHEEAPSDFPANDLETSYEETERREKYNQFINQLCEMERSRAALRNLSKSKATKTQRVKYTTAVTEEPLHLVGYANTEAARSERRAWVQDILREIDPHSYENSEETLVMADGTPPPVGWLLVPAQGAARQSIGSRILFDPECGRKWERLLGTDYYPDLVVLRHLTSRGWTFEGPMSDELLRKLVDWFIASQDGKVVRGMSSFILGMEKELIELIYGLQTVRVGEKLLDMSNDSDPRVAVQKIIRRLENECLESTSVDSSIQPVSAGVFHRLLSYAFKTAKIPREVWATDDKITLVVERWARSQMGLKPGAEPLVPEWKQVWDLVMREKPSSVRLNHFLASMDSWDPMAGVILTGLERTAIAQEWVRIYTDTQLIRGESYKVRSVVLHEEIRRWCLKYIPESIFTSQLSCVNIGPVLTKRGLKVTKLKDGRYILGIKFKSLVGNEEDLAGETVATAEEIRAAEANSVQFTTVTKENEDGTKTKQRTVEHTVVAEKDGARIEHYFAASVTTETIHLGSL